MYVVRHVGDLGNIQADWRRTVTTTFKDNLVSLYGTNNVIGRAVVVSPSIGDFHIICKLATSVGQKCKQLLYMHRYSDLQKLKKLIFFKYVVLKYS